MKSESDLDMLIDSIHDAGFGLREWDDVLPEVAKRIGAKHVNLRASAPLSGWSLDDWNGIDPEFVRSYLDHYVNLDPVVPFALSWQPGTLLTDSMIVPQSALDRSEFYQDWVRPQGMYGIAVASVLRDDGLVGMLGAARGRPGT